MSLNRESIEPLLRELPTWPPFLETGLAIQPLENATFTNEEGWAVWLWSEPDADFRAKGNFLYVDEDGTNLSLTLVGARGLLAEIEIWRGDGSEPRRAPAVSELIVMKWGVIYGPGGVEDG